MAKRKSIKKSNKLFTYNSHHYVWGGDSNETEEINPFDLKGTFSGSNISKMLQSNLGNITGTLGGNFISGGLNLKAGNTIGTIGSTIGGSIGTVNPILGSIVSTGSGLLKGATNALFGSNLNQENINAINKSNEGMNTLMVGNNNIDSIMNQWSNQNFGSSISKSDIGKDGLFSNKATNIYNELLNQQNIARNKVLTSYANAINTADNQSNLNMLANYAAYGGNLYTSIPNIGQHGGNFSNGVTIIGNGGTHEENPMEGVPMGIAPDGIPNLVEQGEVKFNDYIFSNRLFADDKLLETVNLPKSYNGHSFADIAENLSKESSERPNDPISKKGLMSAMTRLQQAQEQLKAKKQNRKYAKGGYLFENGGTWLRYAPVVGAAIGVGQNLFSKPDYTGVDKILEASNQIGNYTPVDYTPIGNYLTYKPFDRNFYTNKLNAQSGATRRAIMNTTSPSRNATLLVADYNAQNALGNIARQAEEYNLAQRQSVEQFNRATNQANAEMGLRSALANQEAELKARSAKLNGIAQAMSMKDNIDARRGASISANLTNLFDSLGNIGIDTMNRNDRDMLIKAGVFGTLSEKPQGWSDKRWEDYKKVINGEEYSKGGKLKKRRGGLTY